MSTQVKITPVGVYDRQLDLFENQYPVPEGISYNSYVLQAGRTALFDTVDARAADTWRRQVSDVLGDTAPDFLIVQHLEPDHASQIDWVMTTYPACRLVCTQAAVRLLPMLTAGYAGFADRVNAVCEGSTLDLQGARLHFITAPMVHWPEVMMVYESTTRTLFSADAFGRFGNPDPALPWACEARRYYFNIVGKYGTPVLKVLAKVADKPIDTIAPLHGPVLHAPLGEYLQLYKTWAAYEPEKRGTLVAYASIHGLTAEAAKYLAGQLRQAGAADVKLFDLCRCDQSEAVEAAFELSTMVVMASTYDGDIFPPMHDFLHHLALKGYSHRTVGIVENGLWAPMAGKLMRAALDKMQAITIAEPTVSLRGRLTPDTETALRTLAQAIAAAQ